jgi:alkylation response protein AidB-like acyl-CoA dehydrogenase
LNDLLLDADEVAFRDEVRGYLVRTAPERDPLQIFRDRGPRTRALYGALGELGWLAIAWPAEFGGGGRPPVFEFILWDELAYARAARLDIGPTVVAKTLMRHGTRAQQDRFLPDLRLGLKGYALGYSEPEAGSDLPGLRVMAVRDGDSYRITGEKRWTSDAHHSDFIWLLARTGTSEQRARGLSLFIVDAHAPGISISPIPTLDGHQVNEVRFDAVEVPLANRIGPENGAWPMMREALAEERHLQVLPGRIRRDLEDLAAWADASGNLADPDLQLRLAEFRTGLHEVEAMAVSLVADELGGDDRDVLAAAAKLVGTSLLQRIARTPIELGYDEQAIEGSLFEFLWRECVVETIGAGTTEMMLDIVSRRGLKLGAG